MSNLKVLLSIISAIVLFLYGLGAFSHEIQEVGGETLKKWLGRLTEKPMDGSAAGRRGHSDCSVEQCGHSLDRGTHSILGSSFLASTW